MSTPAPNRWLFSPVVDLSAFLGSAIFSLVLLAIGIHLGLLERKGTPEWTWVTGVLLIDVAHVWSTAFIVYFDPKELHRRIWLYSLVPLLGFLVDTEDDETEIAGPIVITDSDAGNEAFGQGRGNG